MSACQLMPRRLSHSIMQEEWRTIPGLEGYYEASSLGRIRSVDRISGSQSRRYSGRVLKTPLGSTGYARFNVSLGNVVTSMKVHRAVCSAFHGKAPIGKEDGRHLDGNQLNNVPGNLAWGSHAENMADAVRHGVSPRGRRNGNAVLTDEQAREIKRRALSGEVGGNLAREFRVSPMTVSFIKNGRRWAHI